MPYLEYHDKKIFYTDKGDGTTMVFLHGFTESQKIWTGFAKSLSGEFRIITIDLAGHGQSECIAEVHSMELQAEVVNAVLKEAKVSKCILVGHSMGGYVAMAFAAKYGKKLLGLCLFHSHCFADTPAEQEMRTRTIEVVRKDKFGYLLNFITGLFPEESVKKFEKQINNLVKEANRFPKEGIIAALEGMKLKADHIDALSSARFPVLFIIGLKDTKAPMHRLWEMIKLPPVSETLILRDCGHMGYIESPKATLEAIRHFAQKC